MGANQVDRWVVGAPAALLQDREGRGLRVPVGNGLLADPELLRDLTFVEKPHESRKTFGRLGLFLSLQWWGYWQALAHPADNDFLMYAKYGANLSLRY